MVPASQAEPVVEFKGIVRALTGNQLLHPIPVQHVAPPYQPFHAPPFPKPIHKPQRESMKHRHYTIGDKITLVLMLLLGLSWELSLAVARAIIPISVIPADKLGRTIRPSDRRQAHTTIPQKAEKDATASSESPEHINFSIYSWLGSLLKAAGLVQVLRYLWTVCGSLLPIFCMILTPEILDACWCLTGNRDSGSSACLICQGNLDYSRDSVRHLAVSSG
ncbi:hypothetical protein AcW1_003489 [Taiwanofungus camphoratus]|nr:hypothetical protein AcV5_010437 [Antrodia cinnamomea]KAI0941662.1 hypothetical protein AcW1_003489 [Antrodia cinnamomea]